MNNTISVEYICVCVGSTTPTMYDMDVVYGTPSPPSSPKHALAKMEPPTIKPSQVNTETLAKETTCLANLVCPVPMIKGSVQATIREHRKGICSKLICVPGHPKTFTTFAKLQRFADSIKLISEGHDLDPCSVIKLYKG